MASLRHIYAELVAQVVETPGVEIVRESTGFDNVSLGAEVTFESGGKSLRIFLYPDEGKITLYGSREGESAAFGVGDEYVVGYFNGEPGGPGGDSSPERFTDAREAASKILMQLI